MTHPYTDLKEAAVERMARAWASIDGKADKFELCKRDRAAEDKMGHYLGYLSDAEELAKRSGILSILADYERMKEALESIESLLSEEITTRFGGDAQISEEQMGANSRIYSLLVVPRNIARAALKDKPHE